MQNSLFSQDFTVDVWQASSSQRATVSAFPVLELNEQPGPLPTEIHQHINPVAHRKEQQ